MGYIGYFPQHKTNKHLSVVIGDGSTPVDMTGGGFTTTMDTGDSTIYKPAKYSKATAEFRTGDYMMDTYAAGAQDIHVQGDKAGFKDVAGDHHVDAQLGQTALTLGGDDVPFFHPRADQHHGKQGALKLKNIL